MSKFTEKLTKAEDTYTFDDFLIKPGLSSIEPKDVTLNTKVYTNFDLNIPIVSSAMDPVTESEMAISLARQGGLGVIHRNLTIEQEVKEEIIADWEDYILGLVHEKEEEYGVDVNSEEDKEYLQTILEEIDGCNRELGILDKKLDQLIEKMLMNKK